MTVPTATPMRPFGDQRPPGRVADRVFRAFAAIGAGLVLVILTLILVSTTREAWPAFSDQGLSYLTSSTWDVVQGSFGTLAFTFGTLVVSTIALCIAVPVSLGEIGRAHV